MLETPDMAGLTQALQKLWAQLIGPSHPAPRTPMPPVVVHDPAAQRAHDLDDPFFDEKVQARMADVIAHAGEHK
jgi:hypothetical protein